MNTFSLVLLGTALMGASSAMADNKWNDANNPKNFESDYQYNFSALPTSGGLTDTTKGWSDSYWPATRGSILDRWQQPAQAFKYNSYVLPTKNQIPYLSAGQLNLLSPAEKFDIIRGQFDLPLSNDLKKLKTDKNDWWKGVCNGWTVASLNFNEPKPINFKSPVTGQVVPLGSSDVKALLAYYYGLIQTQLKYEDGRDVSVGSYVGQMCSGTAHAFRFFNHDACDDVNAGSFHVMITNEMGLRHHGLAMDIDPGEQVWNQPFLSYITKVVSQESNPKLLTKNHSKEAVKEVTMETTMTYANELYNTTDEDSEDDHHVAPSYQPTGAHTRTITYHYVLELDVFDRIIGGYWIDSDKPGLLHPDMIWRQSVDTNGLSKETSIYKDDWTVLSEIVRQSTGN